MNIEKLKSGGDGFAAKIQERLKIIVSLIFTGGFWFSVRRS